MRVFVSSTFLDMQAEREELVKHVFPRLRHLCESRGVTWGEVDLRWGVTDEQRAEGRVLPICLTEIRTCRPYFIGLLGERYGWVPEDFPPTVLAEHPWLESARGHSVTELEILHGVLNDPGMAEHAFFYFRNPDYLASLPPARQSEFREGPTPEEIRRFGSEEATRRAIGRRDKLAALKARLRASRFPVRLDYPDPRALGELVLGDLTGVIERLFPEGSQPDPLDRERAEQEAYAATRRLVFIGRGEYVRRLDRHVAGEGPPLVLTGEPGSGKTALLANWAASRTSPFLLAHFIGSTAASTDWAAMLRRILGELERQFGGDPIPEEDRALQAAFVRALHAVASRHRIVLLLDAVDQLQDREAALDLGWLPLEIPSNIRLILSTRSGRSLDEVRRREWPTMALDLLLPDERSELIERYLAQYAKRLTRAQVEDIARCPRTENPLYLVALLEELRVYGDHDTLRDKIREYTSAGSLGELCERILARYETDYDRDRPGLVSDAMRLLWAARRGLSEAELLDLLGPGDRPLPHALWSPLYLAARQWLVSRAGVIGFSHEHLRQAVERRYLQSEADRREAHLRLAGYFAARPLGTRKIEELPWHLAEAGSWERLNAVLAELDFLAAAWRLDKNDVRATWARLETDTAFRMADTYAELVRDPRSRVDDLEPVASLLDASGYPGPAATLYRAQADRCMQTGDAEGLARVLGNLAIIAHREGNLDEAMAIYQEQERLYRSTEDQSGLAVALGNQALVLKTRGDLDDALEMQQEVEAIARRIGDRPQTASALINQANILQFRGDLDGAATRLSEAERIHRALGNLDGLQLTLGNRAGLLYLRGERDAALDLLREAERICRTLGDKEGLQRTLCNLAVMTPDRDQALALFQEQERICRELGNAEGLFHCLLNQSVELDRQGQSARAEALLTEGEAICRGVGNRKGLAECLHNQAALLEKRGDLLAAAARLEEYEGVCRELGDGDALTGALTSRANLLDQMGQPEAAVRLLEESERLCRDLGNDEGLALALAFRAQLLAERLDASHAALPLVQEAFRRATALDSSELAEAIRPLLDSVYQAARSRPGGR